MRQDIDNVFAPINKSQIPTGILDEYGLGITEAQQIDAADTLDLGTWRGLYHSLFSARIFGSQTLPILDSLNARINNYSSSVIQLPVIHYNYNSLRPDAVSANLLRVQNNQLYDVAGRTQSPYLSKTVFATALSQSYSLTSSVSFIVRTNLIFNNTGKTRSQINLDAGQGGGWQPMTANTPLVINYTTAGKKLIKLRFTYTDGTQAIAQSLLDVLQGSTVANRYEAGAGFNININSTANHAGASLRVVLSQLNPTRTTTQRLMKPFIVVEGYDASQIVPTIVRPYGYESFIASIDRQSLPYDFNFNLDEQAGYDLVFVDYNNGTDDIRRNAAMLQDVLRWVNANKVNNVNNANLREQNVVMGMSMGGLVAATE